MKTVEKGELKMQLIEKATNTQEFTEWLQFALAEFDDVKLRSSAVGGCPSYMYSEDGKISETIYEFCNGGALHKRGGLPKVERKNANVRKSAAKKEVD